MFKSVTSTTFSRETRAPLECAYVPNFGRPVSHLELQIWFEFESVLSKKHYKAKRSSPKMTREGFSN